MAAEALRIDVEDARRRSAAGEALLVCAYDDEDKCRTMRIAGAMTLHDLQRLKPSLDERDQIIMYCA